MTEEPDTAAFYTDFFTKDPDWSTAYPNSGEARRAAVIVVLLSRLARAHRTVSERPLRILDLGCGRGWLTYVVDVYGECLGIDPVEPVIEFARSRFPHLRFEVGTADDLLGDGRGGEFDVVIASEVIEHVPPAERQRFVKAIRSLLRPGGAAIVSTDRGELYARWVRHGGGPQPVEVWLTEPQVRELFTCQGFCPIQHERVSWEQPPLSFLHKAVLSKRVYRFMTRTRQRWLLEGLRFLVAECQIWLFRLPQD